MHAVAQECVRNSQDGDEAGTFDFRARGKDERVPVMSFFEGQDYLYRLVRMLAGG